MVSLIADEKLLNKPDDYTEEEDTTAALLGLEVSTLPPSEETKHKDLVKKNLLLSVRILKNLSSCESVKDYLRTGGALHPLIQIVDPLSSSELSLKAFIAVCNVTNIDRKSVV